MVQTKHFITMQFIHNPVISSVLCVITITLSTAHSPCSGTPFCFSHVVTDQD